MDWCNRCEYKATNESNQYTQFNKLWIDVTGVNIKLQMRVINRYIILSIMDGYNRCEYKSTNKSNQ